MEKILSLQNPHFDMLFNFQPFGVNRKIHNPAFSTFYGDEAYQRYLELNDIENKLNSLEECYISKLAQFENNVKTICTIKIAAKKYGYYYDLIYTTRKDNPRWIDGINHLKNMIEKIRGYEVAVIFDTKQQSLNSFMDS